jgi:hypothetical protein
MPAAAAAALQVPGRLPTRIVGVAECACKPARARLSACCKMDRRSSSCTILLPYVRAGRRVRLHILASTCVRAYHRPLTRAARLSAGAHTGSQHGGPAHPKPPAPVASVSPHLICVVTRKFRSRQAGVAFLVADVLGYGSADPAIKYCDDLFQAGDKLLHSRIG